MTIDEVAKAAMDLLAVHHTQFDSRATSDYVYHYTSYGGLEGILSGKSLWVNETTYMNDRMELKEFGEQSIYNLEQMIYDTDRQPHPRNRFRLWEIDYFSNHVRERFRDVAYLASFSAVGNLLSQWRAYCPQGGVSIGVPLEALRTAATKQSLTCTWCEYDRPDWLYYFVLKEGSDRDLNFPRIWHNLYKQVAAVPISQSDIEGEVQTKNIRDALARYGTAVDDEREKMLAKARISLRNLSEACFKISPIFKHQAFKEEQEFRVFTTDPDRSNLGLRSGPRGYVTYVPLPLRECFEDSKIAIWVGPCEPAQRDSLSRAVEILLKKHGIENADIRHSNVPLRLPCQG